MKLRVIENLPVLKFADSSEENLYFRRLLLEKQGYKLVGNHSAIKICNWCKSSINNKLACYKNTFYGIKSWQCIQASVTLDICNLRCEWCWRDIDYNPKNIRFTDEPRDIVKGFIEKQQEILIGYYGSEYSNKIKLDEGMKPRHVALSLTGDACMYPRLPELIDEIHRNSMTSFLVTNGTFTDMVNRLIDHQPTQMYITLPAPDEKTFEEVCKPLGSSGWGRIMNSISLLKHFRRSVIRMTLAKGWNFKDPEKYAEIINNNEFDFLELKSAMPIGGAMYRMVPEQMITHQEIKEFANEIAKFTDFKIIDEQEESRVVLMAKEDREDRVMHFV